MSLAEDLRKIEAFATLPLDALDWLASRMTVVDLPPGHAIVHEGDPATHMFAILEGELRAQKENGPGDGRTYGFRAGQLSGMLPYSRLKQFPVTSRAVTPTRVAKLPADDFPEMLDRIPELRDRFVSALADRVRESTRAEQQREKMAALGKLSAGLAHELNNPAAAAQRAAENLSEAMRAYRAALSALDRTSITAAERTHLGELESEWAANHSPAALDSLERSDREEQVAEWLGRAGVPGAWDLAASLIESGATLDGIRQIATRFSPDVLPVAMARLSAAFTMSRLVAEIEIATARISELVRGVKEYSYMDQMPEQRIDVHDGIENTLIMLRHRMRNVNVIREYDRTLPPISAFGSELNQVWTNLIDNALDAMSNAGELRLRTAHEHNSVLVEVRDSGAGIPPEILSRIFEPFFTTKQTGGGLGLGLDTTYRIVQKHHGDIRVESKPGGTCFQIRLPAARQ